MFFLPTRGRPDECRQLIEAMQATGDVPPVAVWIDGDPSYADVKWPSHWPIHNSPERVEMTAALNGLLALYPDEPSYGFFGDHFRPLTAWSKQLEEAAGDWMIAWPCDGESSFLQPAGCPTFGGKLIRKQGWICLPSTVHVCTDRVWHVLWKDLGIAKHVQSVRFTRTWPLGQGSVPRSFKGQDFNAHDRDAYSKWEPGEGQKLMADIREDMKAEGYEFGPDGRLADKYGTDPFRPGW